MTETRSQLQLAFGRNLRESQHRSGDNYGCISPRGIVAMVENPQSLAKQDAPWFLPTSYRAHDARQYEAQRRRGEFHLLVLDIDRGNLFLDELKGILTKVIGLAAYLVYATKSATKDNRKWRVLIPVNSPISGEDYEETAKAFMLEMEQASLGRLILDPAAARPAQVFYLPNRGDHYEYAIISGEYLYDPPVQTPPARLAVPVSTKAMPKQPTESKSNGGNVRLCIQKFNDTHDLVEQMHRYGYVRNGNTNDFRSPLQTTESYATRVYPDSKKWVSHSGSDAAAGLGSAKGNFVWGDAFDLYRHYEHGGSFESAIASILATSDTNPTNSNAASSPRIDLPHPATLDGSGLQYLETVLDEHRGDPAYVYAVALRLSSRVPHQWSLNTLQNFISDYAELPLIKNIMFRVERFIDSRKTVAMKPSTLGIACIRTNVSGRLMDHELVQVDRLTPLSIEALEKGGVFAIRAPMGAGKTQEIGRPLVDWAKKNNRSIMAIAHRVSLVAEMARRLGLSDYRNFPNIDPRRLAICLPSILKEYAQTKPEVLFIDEILQTLQFLVSEDCCSTREGGPDAVFKALCKLIREAHVVVVADAGLSDICIEILAYCRPHDSIQTIHMHPLQTEKVADIYCGSSLKVRDAVSFLVMEELRAGGKVWFAVESPKLAKALAKRFTFSGFSVLCVHSEVKGKDNVAALLADADFNSRKYDIVIASPVISSGVSIEHREQPHFTLGAYIGGGWVAIPADAMQQIGRVRYLQRFILGIEANNVASGGQVWTEEIAGRVSAARLEQSSTLIGPFDGLVAHFKATHENARSDFGAGLYWHLEGAGWAVNRNEIVASDGAVSEISKALREERECALQEVDHIDDDTSDFLRRSPLTEETAIRLEAYAIQQAFAVERVTSDELSLWANGSFAHSIERFEDAFGVGQADQRQTSQIVHRPMRVARTLAYAKLLDGVDIRAADWGTPEVMKGIVDRMMLEPQLYVSIDILPKKYAARFQRKDGSHKPIRRPQNVGKVMTDFLLQLGLKANKTTQRIDGQQMRVIGTDMELFGRVQQVADRRAERGAARVFEWSEDDDPDL